MSEKRTVLGTEREPDAWLEVHEGSDEVLDATLIKPDGGEPGVKYIPLFSTPVSERTWIPGEPRVVCAALRRGETIVCGPRHWDQLCRGTSKDGWEQGFVDQRGNFLTREEAWKVAERNGQIIRRCGGDGERLYSENLY